MGRGGKRENSGAKLKYGTPTKVVRVPKRFNLEETIKILEVIERWKNLSVDKISNPRYYYLIKMLNEIQN